MSTTTVSFAPGDSDGTGLGVGVVGGGEMHLPPSMTFPSWQTHSYLGACSSLRSKHSAYLGQSPLSLQGPAGERKEFENG